MKQPILITGTARSGTSLCAGIIDLCGAFGGNTQGVNRYNEKGMYENLEIRRNIVKPYLKAINVDERCQYPLPVNRREFPEHVNLRNQVEKVMRLQGYKGGEWYYKCVKVNQIWPVWQQAFPQAKWIIVRRNTDEIVESCLKTGFMTAFKNTATQQAAGVSNEREGWQWWVNQHLKRFEEMKQHLDVMEVWPEKMIDGDYSEIARMLPWLGLQWSPKIVSFIEPKLWKAKQKRKGVK